MRVYVPATVEILQQLVADQEFDPMSRTAFAVTPTLRESYAAGTTTSWPRSPWVRLRVRRCD